MSLKFCKVNVLGPVCDILDFHSGLRAFWWYSESMENKLHVLVVDDDPLMRRLVGGWVAQLGMESLYAHDGIEGLDSAQKLHPDLILLDYHMPHSDGIQAASRLKEDPTTKAIPIMFLTNEDLSPEAEAALKQTGVADYMHKSISFDDFAERVKKVLPAARQAAAIRESGADK